MWGKERGLTKRLEIEPRHRLGKEPVCQKWNGEFPSEISGPSPELPISSPLIAVLEIMKPYM